MALVSVDKVIPVLRKVYGFDDHATTIVFLECWEEIETKIRSDARTARILVSTDIFAIPDFLHSQHSRQEWEDQMLDSCFSNETKLSLLLHELINTLGHQIESVRKGFREVNHDFLYRIIVGVVESRYKATRRRP